MVLHNKKLAALCLAVLVLLFALQFVLSSYMILAATRILILAVFAIPLVIEWRRELARSRG